MKAEIAGVFMLFAICLSATGCQDKSTISSAPTSLNALLKKYSAFPHQRKALPHWITGSIHLSQLGISKNELPDIIANASIL